MLYPDINILPAINEEVLTSRLKITPQWLLLKTGKSK